MPSFGFYSSIESIDDDSDDGKPIRGVAGSMMAARRRGAALRTGVHRLRRHAARRLFAGYTRVPTARRVHVRTYCVAYDDGDPGPRRPRPAHSLRSRTRPATTRGVAGVSRGVGRVERVVAAKARKTEGPPRSSPRGAAASRRRGSYARTAHVARGVRILRGVIVGRWSASTTPPLGDLPRRRPGALVGVLRHRRRRPPGDGEGDAACYAHHRSARAPWALRARRRRR